MAELPPLRDVIAQNDLRAKKSLGQNFLLDLNLTDRIATAAGPLDGVDVLEVGPGPGGLTRSLLKNGARKVIAVERDPRCLDALQDLSAYYQGKLTVIEADALRIDEPALLYEQGIDSARVIANLPYNIGSKLLVKWLTTPQWPPWYSSLTLLFQKEVAERIVAAPGSKAYGRLSVMAQWRCTADVAFDIPARAFTPSPKVNSSLVVIRPARPCLENVEIDALEKVVAVSFGQRRKMIKRSLSQLSPNAGILLSDADIDPSLRAENIDIEGFCRLARAYCRMRDNMPDSDPRSARRKLRSTPSGEQE